MIDLTLKGLAKFMTAAPAQQRKVLRDYKYPEPEGRAQATYYAEARTAIRSFVKGTIDGAELLRQARTLEARGSTKGGRGGKRLEHNGRALRQYHKHFGGKSLTALAEVRFKLIFDGVSIAVAPDLHVIDGKTERFVRLEFAREAPDDRVIRIMTQAIFESAAQAGIHLKSSSVSLWDVPRGTTHAGARMGARMRKDIEATCKVIESIWPGI